MMQLSKDEIQFIDNYLQKAEVVYFDIRSEMVDHIASAVEVKMENENLDFYNAFKAYMAINKKEVLKNNKNLTRFSLVSVVPSFQEIKLFLKFMSSSVMILVLTALLLLAYCFRLSSYFDSFIENSPYYFIITILVIAVAQFFITHLMLKKRFYYLEKSSQILTILYWLRLVVFPDIKATASNQVLVFIFVFLMLGYVIYTVRQVRMFYKLKLYQQ
ncbi:hypothetical protein ABGT15_09695 [Flavobacterium enshiense]|uniref:hypothetical protein n=1 Tax=Flavobacterium enshiense TaxID=1341165 RepID=UPI00345C9192